MDGEKPHIKEQMLDRKQWAEDRPSDSEKQNIVRKQCQKSIERLVCFAKPACQPPLLAPTAFANPCGNSEGKSTTYIAQKTVGRNPKSCCSALSLHKKYLVVSWLKFLFLAISKFFESIFPIYAVIARTAQHCVHRRSVLSPPTFLSSAAVD